MKFLKINYEYNGFIPKMYMFLVVLLILLPEAASRLSDFNNDTDNTHHKIMQKLTEMVFEKCNKQILPRKPVVVALSILLLKVKTTVERDGIFESVIALFMEWNDPRMQWNPNMYDNITEISFDSGSVWLPDIALTNSADHMYSISKDTTFVIRLSHKGIFNFVPTGTAKTWCDLELMKFPFDIQSCPIEFESWSLNTDSLVFNESSSVVLDPNFKSLQFSLCSYSHRVYEYYYEVTDESFSRLNFEFVVRRKTSFYMVNLIFPIATLSVIQPLVFFIPLRDSSSDRVGFGTTNMLTLVVFQTMITAEMPKTSNAMTALSKYIISLIILSGWAILESIMLERLTRTWAKPPPTWISQILQRICPFNFEHIPSVPNYFYSEDDDFVVTPKPHSTGVRSKSRTKLLSKLCCIKTLEVGEQLFVREKTANIKPLSAVAPFHENMKSKSNTDVRHVNFDNSKPSSGEEREKKEPPRIRIAPRRRLSLAGRAYRKNKEQWEDLALRIDLIMFLICMGLTILIPLLLFVPIAMFDDSCPIDLGHK